MGWGEGELQPGLINSFWKATGKGILLKRCKTVSSPRERCFYFHLNLSPLSSTFLRSENSRAFWPPGNLHSLPLEATPMTDLLVPRSHATVMGQLQFILQCPSLLSCPHFHWHKTCQAFFPPHAISNATATTQQQQQNNRNTLFHPPSKIFQNH